MLGQVVAQGAALLRNILLARLLAPEDFGLATTFMLVMSMLEMLSNLSAEMLLVQSKEGGSPRYLHAMHGFILVRGAVVSILVYLLAGSITEIFKVPDLEWAFQVLAVAPLIKAFVHLEYKQVQRNLNFRGELFVEAVPQLGAVVVLYPLFMIDDAETLGLWIVLIQVILVVIVSHLQAMKPYRVSFDKQVFRDVFRFGLPLVFSAFLMFFAVQGDRFIVGHYFSAEVFGIYSAVALLIMNASNAIAKFSTSLMLPVLAQSSQEQRLAHLKKFDIVASIFALSSAVVVALVGDDFVELVFGAEYGLEGLVTTFMLLFGCRLIRFPITVYYLSKANTVPPLISNAMRFIGVVLAFYFANNGGNILYVVAAGAVGEVLAYLTARIISVREVGDISRSILLPLSVFIGLSVWLY